MESDVFPIPRHVVSQSAICYRAGAVHLVFFGNSLVWFFMESIFSYVFKWIGWEKNIYFMNFALGLS